MSNLIVRPWPAAIEIGLVRDGTQLIDHLAQAHKNLEAIWKHTG
jgi:hypothetical protein